MDARRVDADSSDAMDGTARLSVRPLRGVELRLSVDRDVAVYLLPFVSMRYSPVDLMGWAAKRT